MLHNALVEENLPILAQLAHSPDQHHCNLSKHLAYVQQRSLRQIMQAFFREKILPVIYKNNKLIFMLPHSNCTVHINKVSIGSLARYTLFGDVFLQEHSGIHKKITDPLELLAIVATEVKSTRFYKNWQKLAMEIRDHLRNDLLRSCELCNFNSEIMQDNKKKKYDGLLQFLKSHNPIFDIDLFIEQWASQGHPYHPCCKTKLGFSPKEVVQYSPEFHPIVPVLVAAVHKKLVHIETMHSENNFSSWFAAHFFKIWKQWLTELQKQHLAVNSYIPFPVHPWQAEKILPHLFKDQIAKGELHLFKKSFINTTPTLSFRTLASVDPASPSYHIKLPIAIQATSVFRTLNPIASENTPRLTCMLNSILTKEHHFNNTLNILPEIYGLHLKNVSPEQGKNLAAIFRQGTKPYLAADENSIVIAALFQESPISGLSLFIELMHAAGIKTFNEATAYFHHYAALVLGSYLKLYLLYGIALEGHQQNTMAVFRHNYIVRFIARDLEGTDIHISTFKKQKINLQLHPETPNLFKDKENVRNSLLHTVYQTHLGELVLLLARHYQCNEAHFWREVKAATEQIFAELKNKMSLADWQEEYQAILLKNWPCKALLRMRLQDKYLPAGLFLNIKNPLVGI